MTDERLRSLERAWVASGADGDAEAYLEALRRAGAPARALHRVQGRWGTRGSYSAGSILATLDDAAAGHRFPMLDHPYAHAGDARLHAFRDPRRWAIVVEKVGYNPRAGGVQLETAAFGSCLEGPQGLDQGDFHAPVSADGPLEDEETGERLDPRARTLLLRGQRVAIPLEPAHYAARGIELREPPSVALFELLRALLPEHRGQLLATDAEARRRLPPDLAPFLTLDAWRHPDLRRGETPGQTSTFQRLAAALVAGDPDAYAPPDDPNTHWRHWPDGGDL